MLLVSLLVACSTANGEAYEVIDEQDVVENDMIDTSEGEHLDTDGYEVADEQYLTADLSMETEARNLARLCKVWGFSKYTHYAFLNGLRCWDEELLGLIPIVRYADEDAVNDILYEWFVGLGYDGYDLNVASMQSKLLDEFQNHTDLIEMFFDESENHNWESIDVLIIELLHLSLHEDVLILGEHEINLLQMADLSWINEEYLGANLAAALSRFHMIQNIDRRVAPVNINEIGVSYFGNEVNHGRNIDFADYSYRLLGLFRFWNAVNYYFPYLDIIDYDWNALLLEFITKMLEDEGQTHYELTLMALASRLQDVHFHFSRRVTTNITSFFGARITNQVMTDQFGHFFARAGLLEAEGYLVVSNLIGDVPELRLGDVILQINDRDIGEITTDMLYFLPYPNEEKALAYLVRDHAVLRQQTGDELMALDIRRNDEELRVYVETRPYQPILFQLPDLPVLTITEQNIAVLNPSLISVESVYRNDRLRELMTTIASADVDGLIIDLRQASPFINFLFAEYLLPEPTHFVTISRPFVFVPGVFVDNIRVYAGYGQLEAWAMYEELGLNESFGNTLHNLNVVVIMNEKTQSHLEYTVMTIRPGSNVTVLGTNSIGANGDVYFIPLPGATVSLSGLGIYTPEGGQTQRIGLIPDIYVPRTIVGISEGRDEQMEAAIEFLVSHATD